MWGVASGTIMLYMQQWKIAALIVGALILLGVVVAVSNRASNPTSVPSNTNNGTSTIPGTATMSSTTGNAPKLVDFGLLQPPSLVKEVKYGADITAEVKLILAQKISELRAHLSTDKKDYNTWLDLAIRYKQAGDFDKAREVWEYLAAIHPNDSVVLHDLADLYQNFLKDYVKAESYYKQAIDAAPTAATDYIGLHELYRYLLKNPTAAVAILKTGVPRVSGLQNIDLLAALGAYYKDTGDTGNAITYYTKARDAAAKAGNSAFAAQFDAIIASLKK